MKQAEAGAILIVNITEVSSDAIIISASAITAIELHALAASEVTQWIRQDLLGLHLEKSIGGAARITASFYNGCGPVVSNLS
jgi:hypothetical protein